MVSGRCSRLCKVRDFHAEECGDEAKKIESAQASHGGMAADGRQYST
jgi:hypothetical protein